MDCMIAAWLPPLPSALLNRPPDFAVRPASVAFFVVPHAASVASAAISADLIAILITGFLSKAKELSCG
jgi:hypothetical protein